MIKLNCRAEKPARLLVVQRRDGGEARRWSYRVEEGRMSEGMGRTMWWGLNFLGKTGLVLLCFDFLERQRATNEIEGTIVIGKPAC